MLKNIRTYMVFSLFLFFWDSAAGCRVHPTKYACEYFSRCRWDSRGCTVGRRGLNSDSEAYSIFDNFKPKLSYKLEKNKSYKTRKAKRIDG